MTLATPTPHDVQVYSIKSGPKPDTGGPYGRSRSYWETPQLGQRLGLDILRRRCKQGWFESRSSVLQKETLIKQSLMPGVGSDWTSHGLGSDAGTGTSFGPRGG